MALKDDCNTISLLEALNIEYSQKIVEEHERRLQKLNQKAEETRKEKQNTKNLQKDPVPLKSAKSFLDDLLREDFS